VSAYSQLLAVIIGNSDSHSCRLRALFDRFYAREPNKYKYFPSAVAPKMLPCSQRCAGKKVVLLSPPSLQ